MREDSGLENHTPVAPVPPTLPCRMSHSLVKVAGTSPVSLNLSQTKTSTYQILLHLWPLWPWPLWRYLLPSHTSPQGAEESGAKPR